MPQIKVLLARIKAKADRLGHRVWFYTKFVENAFTKWGFGGGFAAPEFLFLVLAQYQKTKVIKQSWFYCSAIAAFPVAQSLSPRL